MAVIEELVSKLGFEVEGLAKLKAAAKEFDRTKKAVIASSNPLKAAGASAGVAAIGVGKLGDQSKKSSRGVLLLSTAMSGLRRAGAVAGSVLRTLLMVAVRLVGAFAGVAAAVAAVAAGFVVLGVKTAKARREMRLAAAEIGTTAQNLETAGNILRVAGFGDKFAEEAKKVIGAVDEVAKTVRKGGEDADEAKKKFQGFGIDKSFNVDPKTGKSRDSAAIAIDVMQAYIGANEQAAALRKQADALGNKAPKKAASLRRQALDKDRKRDQLGEDGGITARLKVLLDQMTSAQFKVLAEKAGRLFPTTSNEQESRRTEVADQAIQAGLKFDALMEGLSVRFRDLGVALATDVLPPLNSFLDSVISFAKRTGIIKETKGEYDARTEGEREARRAAALGSPRTVDEATTEAEKSQRRFEEEVKRRADRRRLGGTPTEAPLPPERPTSLPASDKDTSPATQSLIQWLKSYVSPETSASKMQKQAETKTDSRTYSDIGNDKRTQSVTVNQTLQQDAAAIAAAARNAVLGAISTKGANTSTGALTAP